jgi:hypothetical protein
MTWPERTSHRSWARKLTPRDSSPGFSCRIVWKWCTTSESSEPALLTVFLLGWSAPELRQSGRAFARPPRAGLLGLSFERSYCVLKSWAEWDLPQPELVRWRAGWPPRGHRPPAPRSATPAPWRPAQPRGGGKRPPHHLAHGNTHEQVHERRRTEQREHQARMSGKFTASPKLTSDVGSPGRRRLDIISFQRSPG